jgi:DNA polymerase III delta prime subunit
MQSKLVGSAHLIQGDADAVAQVLELLESQGTSTKANADMYVRGYARFGADDARELRERAASRAMNDTSRIFIIATPSITTDAQNVLLKTLEEPPAGAVFFIIVPAPQALLSTLRSRMQMLVLPKYKDTTGLVDAKEFLAASGEKRLDMLKPLLEKDDDDKRDLRPVLSFLSSLETKLARSPEGLRALYGARKYIGDKGALIKPLLEQVALLVPRV